MPHPPDLERDETSSVAKAWPLVVLGEDIGARDPREVRWLAPRRRPDPEVAEPLAEAA